LACIKIQEKQERVLFSRCTKRKTKTYKRSQVTI
jgi:hypothetical protein